MTDTMNINPGGLRKFHASGLTETISGPSPYKKHRDGNTDHEQITNLGPELLQTMRGVL